jgi:hypothetical protein
MNSDLLTRWTAIITNIAIVIGLVFVGLEFRNNARAVESERIDSLTEEGAEIQRIAIGDAELTDILLRAYAEPESLTKTERDRAQHWMIVNYTNFRRVHRAHQAGLLPDDLYEVERAGVGFSFSSDIGLEVIDVFRSSQSLKNDSWEVVSESAEQARAYCDNSQNACLDRYM